MKICILGDNKSYYENKIKEELELMNLEVKIANLTDIFLHINSFVKLEHRKLDLLEFDKFLFWDIREEHKTEIYRIANYLKSKNKIIIDQILGEKQFSEIDDLIELKRNNINTVEFFEILNLKTARDILIELEHPIFIKIHLKKSNKKKLIFSTDWTDSYDYIRTENFSKLQLFKIDTEINIIRSYLIGNKLLGTLEIIPKSKKPKLSYEIKKFKYKNYEYEVEGELEKISQDISNILNTSICYIEYIKTKNNYIVCNVKRMPKFKVISKITGINFSSKIGELIANA